MTLPVSLDHISPRNNIFSKWMISDVAKGLTKNATSKHVPPRQQAHDCRAITERELGKEPLQGSWRVLSLQSRIELMLIRLQRSLAGDATSSERKATFLGAT